MNRPSLGLRHSGWDGLLVGLALLQGALLLSLPSIPLIAIGLWWDANTVAHNFIHLPFFKSQSMNRLFTIYLTLVQSIPQTLWRDRHLAHHAGSEWRLRLSGWLGIELVLLLAAWMVLLVLAPRFLFSVYLPGYLLGLGLCWLQGHYEHARGTTSHYGTLYNLLFFNDGYHLEHHGHPGEHWTSLPQRTQTRARSSRWPAVLRWFDGWSLDTLEGLVLRSARLQRYVVTRHERAFRILLPKVSPVRRVGIVGGGLFPRTALVLGRLLPDARLIVMDASAEHLAAARPFLGADVELVHQRFNGASCGELELVIIPLAFVGDRAAIYRNPPAPTMLVHDWIWRRRGESVVISWPLLKRLNLVRA